MDQGKPDRFAGLPRSTGALRLAGLARLAYSWSDILTVTEVKRTHSTGLQVSCGKGCAACCRECIPVSPAEAFLVAETLAALPADHRAARVGRFASARTTWLDAAPPDAEAYFRLQIDCPFLDAETCSAHSLRPLACREHLVTSAPEHCSSFPDFSIRVLPLRHAVGEPLRLVCAELLGRPPEIIPLTEAPAWAEAHAEEGRRAWDAERVAEALAHHVFSR